MTIPTDKARCTFTISPENVNWLADWLKRHGAPRFMLSQLVGEYLAGVRSTLEELDRLNTTPTIGDLFKITGDSLNRLKQPPLM